MRFQVDPEGAAKVTGARRAEQLLVERHQQRGVKDVVHRLPAKVVVAEQGETEPANRDLGPTAIGPNEPPGLPLHDLGHVIGVFVEQPTAIVLAPVGAVIV